MIVAVTGHTTERLRGSEEYVKPWLEAALFVLKSRYKDIIAVSGMAVGVDQIYAQVAIDMNIPLQCCFAYKRKHFHPAEQEIMDKANDIIFVGDKRRPQSFIIRDRYMVDHCDILLAVWDGIEAGGTWDTIEYAKDAGKKIIYCPEYVLESAQKVKI